LHSTFNLRGAICRSRSYFTTDVSQSVCLGIEYPCRTCDQILLPVGMLLSEICGLVSVGAPSLTRGRVCNLQCNHSVVRVAQNPKPYFTVSSETSPTWRARFPYLYPPRTGWPSYTPGTGFPLRRLLRLASYNPPGYGGGILTLPFSRGTGPCIYSLQEWDGPVQSQVLSLFIYLIFYCTVTRMIGYGQGLD
jgi:hypothetical protein